MYLLHDGEYHLTGLDKNEPLCPQAFSGVAINPGDIWEALD